MFASGLQSYSFFDMFVHSYIAIMDKIGKITAFEAGIISASAGSNAADATVS